MLLAQLDNLRLSYLPTEQTAANGLVVEMQPASGAAYIIIAYLVPNPDTREVDLLSANGEILEQLRSPLQWQDMRHLYQFGYNRICEALDWQKSKSIL